MGRNKIGILSLILQDDISRMKNFMKQVRSGTESFDRMLREKQLAMNYDKSKYLVLGSDKFKKNKGRNLSSPCF